MPRTAGNTRIMGPPRPAVGRPSKGTHEWESEPHLIGSGSDSHSCVPFRRAERGLADRTDSSVRLRAFVSPCEAWSVSSVSSIASVYTSGDR